MRNVKVGFKKNEYYQADQLPRFTRYECQSRHLLVQDELEQLNGSARLRTKSQISEKKNTFNTKIFITHQGVPESL